MRLLAVIDMQEDFVRGVLRVPGIKSKIMNLEDLSIKSTE